MPLTLKAHVEQGRLVVDEKVDLPDGMQVRLEVVTDADDLDDADRARLHAAIEEGLARGDRDEGIPAEDLIAELRSRPPR
jgi:hypothetical protein